MGQPIRLVIEHAQRNGGIVTIQEAIALGMSRSTVYRRIADGILIALRPGILALPGTTDPFVLALSAACAKLNAVVSHQAAAHLHGLDQPRHVKPTVRVPVRKSKEMAGVTVHQLTDLDPSHIVDRDGLPITSAERTVIDLAAVLHESHLSRVVDNGLAARSHRSRRSAGALSVARPSGQARHGSSPKIARGSWRRLYRPGH